jgi:hypothetical protein
MRAPRVSIVFSLSLLSCLLLSPRQAAAVTFYQEARLMASDAAAGDGFGAEVALSSDGTLALVGAPGDDCSAGADCGAAYVFVRSVGGWSERAKLTAPDAAANARLGHSIALSGDGSTLLLRARSTDCIDSADCAIAYVFRSIGGSWVETARLKTSGPFQGSSPLGPFRIMALSADGRTALLGAPNTCMEPGPCGFAHIYTRSGESWSEETRLEVGGEGSRFGESVDLSKDGLTALVGMEGSAGEETPDGGLRTVAAYAFIRSGGTWVLQQRLTVSGNDFETGPVVPVGEVTLSGDGNTALVSYPFGGCGHQLENGSGYCGVLRTFVRAGGGWTERPLLGALGTFGFGTRAALSGDGAILMTTTPGARVYARREDAWVERQRHLSGHAMSLSENGLTALTGVSSVACPAGDGCGAAFIYGAAPIAVIPTSSEWGLILLTLLLAASGWTALRRRPRPAR